jgi:hypothetical protein
MRGIYQSRTPKKQTLLLLLAIAVLVGLTSWVLSAAGIVAAAQVGAAGGTLITALLILAQVREMQEARLAQERPQVIVDIDNSISPFIYVVVRNIGKGAARDISFEFSAPVEIPEGRTNPNLAPESELPYFKNGLPYLAPGAEISSLWGSMRTLGSFLREKGLHEGIKVTSRYKSVAGEPGFTEWVLNPLLLVDKLSIDAETVEDHVQNLAAGVEVIARNTGETLRNCPKSLGRV